MKKKRNKNGVTLMAAMVCLVVVTATGGWLVSTTLTRTRLVQSHAELAQREWLFAAAFERAAVRLAAASDYDGEKWQLDDRLPRPAQIDIRITRDPNTNTATIQVVNRYPVTSPGTTRQRDIQVPQSASE